MSHTPGPWTHSFTAIGPPLAKTGGIYPVVAEARVDDLSLEAYERATANARLIAAAPEMAALLRDFVDMVTKPVSRGYLDVAVDRARTLLLKIDEGPNSERSEG